MGPYIFVHVFWKFKTKIQNALEILRFQIFKTIFRNLIVPPKIFNDFNVASMDNLSMKQGCLFVLFCAYEIHQTRMLQIAFLVSLESSWGGGVHQLGSMTFGFTVQKFLNIEWFLHLKFWRNWNVPIIFLEISWWGRFNGIYLLRFGFKMW